MRYRVRPREEQAAAAAGSKRLRLTAAESRLSHWRSRSLVSAGPLLLLDGPMRCAAAACPSADGTDERPPPSGAAACSAPLPSSAALNASMSREGACRLLPSLPAASPHSCRCPTRRRRRLGSRRRSSIFFSSRCSSPMCLPSVPSPAPPRRGCMSASGTAASLPCWNGISQGESSPCISWAWAGQSDSGNGTERA